MPFLPDPSDSAQLLAAQKAILREYGRVIGEQQAANIAYHVLAAARRAVLEAQRMEGK